MASTQEFHLGNTKTSQSDDINLCVVPEVQCVSTRPIFPATKYEKLSYIRSYVSSPARTDVVGVKVVDFNVLLWNYLQGVIFNSINCYVYLFLGSYAAEHHLFLSKMWPAINGLNIIWICYGVCLLIWNGYPLTSCLDGIITGISYDHPWDRCIKENYEFTSDVGTKLVTCYTLDKFIKKASNRTLTTTVDGYFYDPEANEYLLISQLFYDTYLMAIMIKPVFSWFSLVNIYINMLWIISSFLVNQIFKNSIWKILHVTQCISVVFYAAAFLFFCCFWATNIAFRTQDIQYPSNFETKARMDCDFLAGAMHSPPILHILTARSKEEGKLVTDTLLLLASSTSFFLFRAYVANMLLRYCVFITKAQLHYIADKNSIYPLWALFFVSIKHGHSLSLLYFILIFVVDYLTFIITHHCLIEVIVCEWRSIKRWQAAVMLCIVVNICSTKFMQIWVMWLIIYGDHCATCIQLLIVTFLYPLGRFIEDITFHNGNVPSAIIILGLRLMFVYYVLRFLYLAFKVDMLFSETVAEQLARHAFKVLMCVLICLGGLLAAKLYDIIGRQKKDWKLIFVPERNWGPFNVNLRLLRKKFDSSKFIASQAPRDLSRYFIQKSEPKSYRLDLRYDLSENLYLHKRQETGEDILFKKS